VRGALALVLAGALALVLAGALAGPVAAETERVELRSDCPRDAADTCFSDLSTLDHWLWQSRRPSAHDPVTVHVGPGEFRGRLLCRAQGFVHFRGVDPARSKLVGTVDEMPFATVRSEGCTELRFERLTIVSPRSRTRRGKAVFWSGAGDSFLRDVALEAEYVAWYDSNCPYGNGLPPLGTHRVERSTLRAGALGYFSDCGHGLLSETEIVVAPEAETALPFLGPGLKDIAGGVKASHRARVELLDCRVSVDSSRAPQAGQTLGLLAGAEGNHHPKGAGLIEMRGGVLRVTGSASATTHAARANRFGQTDAPPARVRVGGTTLELSPPDATRTAGDGVVEWLEPARR
jgi:hypothetical protein